MMYLHFEENLSLYKMARAMEPRIFATEVIEIKPCQNDRRATETVFFNWLTELNEMFSGLIFPKMFWGKSGS